MPLRSWRLRIEDILQAVAKIERYMRGADFSTFRSDGRTVDAVVRNIEIVGEAARYIPTEIENRFASIPWAEMRDMRHRVVHGYFQVDVGIVWQTCKSDLPPLIPLLREVLQEIDLSDQ